MPRATLNLLIAFLLLAGSTPAHAVDQAASGRAINQAYQLLRKGRGAQAAALLRAARDKDPRDPTLHLAYQSVMYDIGKYDEVHKDYGALLKAHGKDGMAYLLYAGTVIPTKESESIVDEGLRADPDNIWLKGAKSMIAAAHLADQGKEDEALRLASDPAAPGMIADVVHSVRGTAFDGQGKFDQAISEYKMAIAGNPSFIAYQMELAQIYADLADYQKALPLFRQALQLHDSPETRYALATTIHTMGKPVEARREYRKIAAMHPLSAGDYQAVGWAQFALGKNKQSWQSMTEYQKMNEGYNEPKLDMAYLEATIFGAKEARKDYDELLAINPHNASILLSSGMDYMGLGQYQKAIDQFKKIVKVNPRNWNAWWGQGCSDVSLGRQEQGIKELLEAFRILPNNFEVNRCLGSSYSAVKRYDDSLKYYLRASRIDPENAEAQAALGVAYAWKNEHEAAIKAYEQAIKLSDSDDDKKRYAEWLETEMNRTTSKSERRTSVLVSILGIPLLAFLYGCVSGFVFSVKNLRKAAIIGSLAVVIPIGFYFIFLLVRRESFPQFYQVGIVFLWFAPICILGVLLGGSLRSADKRLNTNPL